MIIVFDVVFFFSRLMSLSVVLLLDNYTFVALFSGIKNVNFRFAELTKKKGSHSKYNWNLFGV
jgi:hypothetical protein